MRLAVLAAMAGWVGLAEPALALDKVKFVTNWLADPEQGGFFQAVADGTYTQYGLDVTIIPGGPQTNGALLLLFGQIEFFMGGDMIGSLISDLPHAKPAYVGAGAINTFYAWMKLVDGFKDENIRPYNFNSAPFIMNKQSIQQGYLTAEPFEIEKQGHFKPNVFLLSDYGYDTYSTMIMTRADIIKKNPDLVQRFVDASAIGWYDYLYGDNSKANALIKTNNPDITDAQIAYSIDEMKHHGVIDSGDAVKLGIGAMTDARWKDFFDKMVAIKMVAPTTDYKQAYTLQFVNKGVGVDLRPQ
jgi:NitT/TauT family transport system substrate-binding protein